MSKTTTLVKSVCRSLLNGFEQADQVDVGRKLAEVAHNALFSLSDVANRLGRRLGRIPRPLRTTFSVNETEICQHTAVLGKVLKF